MTKTLLLVLILLKLRNKINNSKNNKILAKSSIITIKKWVTIPINILIKSQKTSFNLNNLFINNFGQYKSCFSFVLSLQSLLLILHYWSSCLISIIYCFHPSKLKISLTTKSSKISALKKFEVNINKIVDGDG